MQYIETEMFQQPKKKKCTDMQEVQHKRFAIVIKVYKW